MFLDRNYLTPLDCSQVPRVYWCTGCGLVANVFKLAALFCLPSVPRSLIWGVQPRDSEETNSLHTETLLSLYHVNIRILDLFSLTHAADLMGCSLLCSSTNTRAALLCGLISIQAGWPRSAININLS